MRLKELMRPNIAALKPYTCARDEAGPGRDVYLDANENWAPIAGEGDINRYPESDNITLRLAVERTFGIPAEMSAIGNGSDEVMDVLYRIFCVPGKDSVLVMPPTYGEYPVLADINDISVAEAPLTDDFQIDEAAVLAAIGERNPKLTFFCSPNNPTGNLLDKETILRVAKANPGITVVDHAYVDFAPEGEITWREVRENPRLVVMRTLSKAWALAGARIGIIIADPVIIAAFNGVKYPYNVPTPSKLEALRGLADTASFEKRTGEILANRKTLVEGLEKTPGVREVLPTDSNFILFRVDEPKRVYEELKERGVVVRDRSSQRGCGGGLRVTVGSAEECARFLSELRAVLEEGR